MHPDARGRVVLCHHRYQEGGEPRTALRHNICAVTRSDIEERLRSNVKQIEGIHILDAPQEGGSVADDLCQVC